MRSAAFVLAAFVVLATLTTATAQTGAVPETAPCAADTVRLASYYYVLEGIRHDRLDGQVEAGDVFTLVVNLQACGSAPQGFAMEFETPPCQTPQGVQRLNQVEDLNSPNVTDDAEPAMVEDLRAALSCDPAIPQAFASAAIVSITLLAILTLAAVFAIRRRGR